MVDQRTIAFYDGASVDYAKAFSQSAPDAQLLAFMDLLPPGAEVLDLGCGPATASAHMRAAGFRCDPVDASDGMIKVANELHDIGARKLTFDQLDAVARYDGVWANFSLLHAHSRDLPRHLAAIARALRPDGVFHIGMKTGDGMARDHLHRNYTYVTEAALDDLLAEVGLSLLSTDHGEGKGMAGTIDPWVVKRARKAADA